MTQRATSPARDYVRLTRPVGYQNNLAEDQFLGDMARLFLRHGLAHGQPEDLGQLGFALVSDEVFRDNFFHLCSAIRHLATVDLSPEQLLVLVCRALGGPGIVDPDGSFRIPRSTETAFLVGFEAWERKRYRPIDVAERGWNPLLQPGFEPHARTQGTTHAETEPQPSAAEASEPEPKETGEKGTQAAARGSRMRDLMAWLKDRGR